MKNIHILPTEIPGRFSLKSNGEYCLSNYSYPDSPNFKNQNIYITSDEEIKDVRPHKGKWHLEKENILNKFPDYLTDLSECKLVIMTTDQDLINDGVQEIDDEFLEWFVKNPNCDWVVLDKKMLCNYCGEENCDNLRCRGYTDSVWYEIIIPKEETKPKTILESLQEYFKNTSKEKVIEDWNEFQHLDEEGITVKEFLENQKQETLEEAAKKYSENWEEITGLDYENAVPSEVNKLDFIKGAKWQQERKYSEEDLRQAFFSGCQSERQFKPRIKCWEEWFEQFKKK